MKTLHCQANILTTKRITKINETTYSDFSETKTNPNPILQDKNNYDFDEFYNKATISKLDSILRAQKIIPVYFDINEKRFHITEIKKDTPLKRIDPTSNSANQIVFDIYTISAAKDKMNFKFKIGISNETDFFFEHCEDFYVEEWYVNEHLWEQTQIYSLLLTNNKYQIDNLHLKQYFKNIQAHITSSNEFAYQNFSAYWNIIDKQSLSNNSNTTEYKYILEPKLYSAFNSTLDKSTDNLITDKQLISSNKYLQESFFVQISVDPVQKLIAHLKTKSNITNRLIMAKRILKLVNQTIKYDHKIINNDIVKTVDIISSKKGVCHHFANLFTALARGVGIPTRMVSGYAIGLNGNVGRHAWNEIEVTNGLWRPIEPQSSSLRFHTYQYFPTAYGDNYENEDYNTELIKQSKIKQFNITYYNMKMTQILELNGMYSLYEWLSQFKW